MAATAVAPAIVGALRCQKDSYLKSLQTDVVSCTEYVLKSGQDKGKAKPQKKSTDPGKALDYGTGTDGKSYMIEFADTILFPEGGGQPTDHGSITPVNGEHGDTIPIKYIQRHGLRAMHFSPKPLQPGTTVRQDVDFHRRWDHMQQHTGQHLLSAIMDTMELETLGWGMALEGEMNYVELSRKPSGDEIRSIQSRCNEVIRQNVPVTVETPEQPNTDTLPEDYDKEKGVVRFIRIGDLDFNACCGTHLKQTSHIALILLHHTQMIRVTNCRLYFSCGDRAIKLATESINGLRAISTSLSSANTPDEVVANVQSLSDRHAEANKRSKKLLGEIARFEGARIKAELGPGKRVFSYRASDGLDFVNLVWTEIKEALKEKGGVVVIASGDVKEAGSMMILGEKELVEHLAAKAKEVVSTLKGGGKGEKWQGKITEWKKGEVDALRKVVEA
ncbi:ThrRS/AlaRS common domain-containing protein [Polyplosphaeria fusca]|uniref:ThrRS/AlaRS common domain-containing protein n=1 Tax=Polyplosphaeria fusca TaxID=682080 RepID=A0A9P4RD88_9PLEO|nr:ThrRS/AlaRS common domain-containing protein [Polyplosphaeria fusca]